MCTSIERYILPLITVINNPCSSIHLSHYIPLFELPASLPLDCRGFSPIASRSSNGSDFNETSQGRRNHFSWEKSSNKSEALKTLFDSRDYTDCYLQSNLTLQRRLIPLTYYSCMYMQINTE